MSKAPRRVWSNIRSNRYAIKPIFPEAEDDTWRQRIEKMNGLYFDDEAKLKFLQSLDQNGKIGLACQAAGISTSTWRKHARQDPKFLEAVEHTRLVFNERRAAKLEKQAMDGFEEVIFGPNGETAYRKKYETQLRVMILKAADREMYADHSTVDVNVSGGAFIVAATLNPDDWEKQFAEQQERFLPDGTNTLDAEGVESQPVTRPGANE